MPPGKNRKIRANHDRPPGPFGADDEVTGSKTSSSLEPGSFEEQLLQQTWGADPWPDPTEDTLGRIDRESFINLKLEGALEKMLGLQMVSMHNNGMRCMHEANNPKRSDASRETYRQFGIKYFAAFGRHFEALARARNKGQQQVIVKHMRIDGGQNVFGNVSPSPKGAQKVQQLSSAKELPTLDIPDPVTVSRRGDENG